MKENIRINVYFIFFLFFGLKFLIKLFRDKLFCFMISFGILSFLESWEGE